MGHPPHEVRVVPRNVVRKPLTTAELCLGGGALDSLSSVLVGSTFQSADGKLLHLTEDGEPITLPTISDRHRLRPLERSDAAELFRLIDANRAYLRLWLPWLEGSKTPADTLAFIDSALRQHAGNAGFHAAICFDGQIVGVIGHHRIDWANRIATIGYWLAESYQGKGIMTASCRAVITHAFETLELNRVEIRCATENKRSRSIPERLGFTHEGTRGDAEWLYDRFIDHAIYAQLRRTWRPV